MITCNLVALGPIQLLSVTLPPVTQINILNAELEFILAMCRYYKKVLRSLVTSRMKVIGQVWGDNVGRFLLGGQEGEGDKT